MSVVIPKKEVHAIVDTLIERLVMNQPDMRDLPPCLPARCMDAHALKKGLQPLVDKYRLLADRGQKVSLRVRKIAYEHMDSLGYKKNVSSEKLRIREFCTEGQPEGRVIGTYWNFRTYYQKPEWL